MMVVCRYFSQGYCRYGNHCRFEHIPNPNNHYVANNARSYDDGWSSRYSQSSNTGSSYQYTQSKNYSSNSSRGQSSLSDREIQQAINQDMDDWIIGNIWRFSVYAPLKEGENFPTFEDASPEELRWNYYNAKLQGIDFNYTLEIEKMEKDIHNKRLALKNPSKDVMEALRKLFRREKINVPSNEIFGSPKPNEQLNHSGNQFSTFQFKLPQESSNSQSFVNATPASGTSTIFGNTQSSSMFDGNNEHTKAIPIHSSTQEMSHFQQTPVQDQNKGSDSKINFSFSMQHHPSIFGNTTETSAFTQPNNNATYSMEQTEQTNSSPANSFFKGNSKLSSFPNPSNNNSTDSEMYSGLNELSDEEKEQFEAKHFSLGKIPDVKPPKELCF